AAVINEHDLHRLPNCVRLLDDLAMQRDKALVLIEDGDNKGDHGGQRRSEWIARDCSTPASNIEKDRCRSDFSCARHALKKTKRLGWFWPDGATTKEENSTKGPLHDQTKAGQCFG